MKILLATAAGLAAFATVAVLVTAFTYFKCLATGIHYNIPIVYPIALKTGSIVGGAIFILSLIGSPSRRL